METQEQPKKPGRPPKIQIDPDPTGMITIATEPQYNAREIPNAYGQVGYIRAHSSFDSIGGFPAMEGIALKGFHGAAGPKAVEAIDEYEHCFRIRLASGRYFAIPKANIRGWEYVVTEQAL